LSSRRNEKGCDLFDRNPSHLAWEAATYLNTTDGHAGSAGTTHTSGDREGNPLIDGPTTPVTSISARIAVVYTAADDTTPNHHAEDRAEDSANT